MEEQKEINNDIALFVAFFYWGSYGNGSMWQTFDTVYELAKKFVAEYPPNLSWEEKSYEEVVEQFIIKNYKG